MLQDLKKVRSFLSDKNNWVQGKYGYDRHGKPLSMGELDQAVKCCIIGACYKLTNNGPQLEFSLAVKCSKLFPDVRQGLAFCNDLPDGYERIIKLLDSSISSLEQQNASLHV